ncbi:flavin-containing monooxygenase [Rhodococcus opacus]|uniref:flavin-containing monooxygenase n=1 Tax=Rhodococcus opacus TaxID=37919 RepID=UPI000AE3803F|nr:NAD(P)/FAD-dependent oxidoreductase [Rhodococcus opacus]
MNVNEPPTTTVQEFDAVIVGAGFAGLYALKKLRDLGLSVRVFEAGAGVGGTWYHNRYPGARCDIESLDYSYSFDDDLQQDWSWSERYAAQPEILRYLNHVADRFDLRKDVQLDTYVSSAAYDENARTWRFETDGGDRFESRYAIMATGVLSVPQVPAVAGLEDFTKPWYHSGDWPREGVDLRGKRVAVIGTGSSGTQMIPLLAQEADELLVFQRTPNFCMPAQNYPMKPSVESEWKANYTQRRVFARQSSFGHNQASNPAAGKDLTESQRRDELESRWNLGGLYMMRAFSDILTDLDVNEEASEFVRAKIRSIVADPRTAEALSPRGLPLGTKRLCSGTGYYETFNRDNVTLIDTRTAPIERLTANGVLTADGEHAVDVIVFATGFDAMTGALNRLNPVGRDGTQLRQHWAGGPRTYLGLGHVSQ